MIVGHLQLNSHRDVYEGYVPMDYGDYLKKMSKYGLNPCVFYCFYFLQMHKIGLFMPFILIDQEW